MVAPHSTDGPAAGKQALRAALAVRRAGCDPSLGIHLAAHVLAHGLPPGAAVAGYWPLAGEIDPLPLLWALAGRGHVVALPETTPPGHPLLFRRLRPGEALYPGRFGTRHPPGEPVRPGVVLVPLLGFDARLHRLGYGGGYYDRTLAALTPVRTVGCAFGCQRVPLVPDGPHDIPLDLVATEIGLFFPEPAR